MGLALQWLLQKVWQSERSPDAVVVVDADSTLSKNALLEILVSGSSDSGL